MNFKTDIRHKNRHLNDFFLSDGRQSMKRDTLSYTSSAQKHIAEKQLGVCAGYFGNLTKSLKCD